MMTSFRVFTVALLLAISFIFKSELQAQDASPNKHLTYVIVHGAWGGSWAFRSIDSALTAQGHRVYRPSLTGLGERAHLANTDIDLKLHIRDVVSYILYEDLKDIILVGHSYGGMVITGVADSIPERIHQLVYLDAFLPVNGESVSQIVGPQGAAWISSVTKDGFLVAPWVKADQKPPHDVPHPAKTFIQTITLNNPAASRLLATYILTVDAGKKPEEDDFASSYKRAKDKGWSVYTLEADHNPQWSAPVKLVELLKAVVK
jgi:pimeloyl-ACP methyl ester carboxylesterase